MEKAMAPHSSTLAWKIPWAEEPGGLQSMGPWGVGHDWSNLAAAAVVGCPRSEASFEPKSMGLPSPCSWALLHAHPSFLTCLLTLLPSCPDPVRPCSFGSGGPPEGAPQDCSMQRSSVLFKLKKKKKKNRTALLFKYVFISSAALGLRYGIWTLSCSIWDLVSWSRMEPGPPPLGVQSLSHWTTREVPNTLLFLSFFF